MYLRESSMPAQAQWEALFDVELILNRFGLTGEVAELGCGYGTFTLPLARRTSGTVHAIDIDPAMIDTVRRRAGAPHQYRRTAARCDDRGFWPERPLRCVFALQYSARRVAD